MKRPTFKKTATLKKKKTKVKGAKFAGSWELIWRVWDDLRADWKPYLWILVIVTVPIDIISVIPSMAGDASISSFASFAAIVMNVALIWAILRRQETGHVPKLATAYYDSSIALLRFLLVTVALVVMLLPAGLGASLFSAALATAPDVSSASAAELLLVGLVGLILSVPSIWLMTRFALGPLLAIRDGLRPMAALRASRNLTLGRFWRVLGRFLMLGLYIAILSIPASLITVVFAFFKLDSLATFLFEVITTLVALPVVNLYLVRLAASLSDSRTSAENLAGSEPATLESAATS